MEAALHLPAPVVDRRQFLRTAGAAALLAVGTSVSLGRIQSLASRPALEPVAGAAARAVPLEQMHLDTFVSLHGSTFEIVGSGAAVSGTLVGVTDWSAKHPAGWESFSLRFRVPASAGMGQNVYQFWHRELGQFPLLVVPMNSTGHDQFLEAIVHRLPAA